MLRIRFHFDGKCRVHPRYNPSDHGRPTDPSCPGCETLYVIHLYIRIADRRAQAGDGVFTNYKSRSQQAPEQPPELGDDLEAAEGEPVEGEHE